MQDGKRQLRVHWLQHVPFEGLGCIDGWLQARGAAVCCCRLFAGDGLPNPAELDLLIVMGGPMSVNDESLYPWLRKEKRLVREAIDAGVPVLGICLGAQLIASALGAPVYAWREKEIGWFPIRRAGAVPEGCVDFPPRIEVFHWHGETFDLPVGSVRLAESEVCVNQAFQYGRKVIGLQFHLETTEEVATEMVTHCGEELVGGTFIQEKAEILAAHQERYTVANSLMADVLDYLVVQD